MVKSPNMSSLAILDLDPDLLPLGTTPLHVAANNRDTGIVSSLLTHYQWQLNSPLDQVDKHGRTPLCVALQNGRLEVARLLIETGANLEVGIAGSGHTAAEILAMSAYQPLVMNLVADSVKLMMKPACVNTILTSAAYDGNDALLKQLLGDHGTEVNSVDHLSHTALYYACLNGHTSTAQILLDYGATVSHWNSFSSTPLHLTCTRGDVAMLEVLLQEWVCPNPEQVLNIQDSRGCSCAHLTLYHKRFDAFNYLLTHFRHCIDTDLKDANGHSLSGLLFYSRFRLDSIPPDVSSHLPLLSVEEAMWTLHSAVQDGDLATVERSLSLLSPTQMDTFDHTRHTPLMLAATRGHLEISKVLVHAGASPATTSPNGRAALLCACECGSFDVAKFLISLPDVSLTSFFECFSQPLSRELLNFLLDYFHSSTSAQKPAHWQKWLSLAARNRQIGRREFSQLVNQICPRDWLKELAVGKYEYCSPPPLRDTPLNFLPVYVEEQSTESCTKYRESRRFRSSMPYPKRRTFAPFTAPRLPTPSMSFRNLSSTSTKHRRRKTAKKPKPVFYCPLHEAAISGNSDVLGFILSKAPQLVGLKEELLFKTLSADGGQTVVEIMARSFTMFEDQFDSWLVSWVKKGEKFGAFLPDGVRYELALLHYILVSAGGKVLHSSQLSLSSSATASHPCIVPQPSRTPLDKW